MLLRLFKGNDPGVIFLIAVTFAAVWIAAFIHPPEFSSLANGHGTMPLYELLSSLAGKNKLLGVTISFSIAVLIAFLLVNFNTTSFFINERTYLPALFYCLVPGFFPEYQSLNPALPAAFFLVLAIIRIAGGYRKPGIANNFFDAGLLISTGSLFYADLLWFGIIVIIGIVLIRTVTIHELAIAVFGLLTPYIIAFGIYYVTGRDLKGLLSLIAGNLFMRIGGYIFSRLTIVALIFVATVILVSIVYLLSLLNIKKIKARKTFLLLLWTFLLSVAAYIILPSVSVEMMWITGIPASYFLTHYFVFIKKRLIPEVLLSLFFLLMITIQISYYL